MRAFRVTIFGTGYVGLVSAATLAEAGHRVACVDIDDARVTRLRSGDVPFHEPGLPELLHSHLVSGRLVVTTNVLEAVQDAEIILLAVGTPAQPDGAADLAQINAAADAVGAHLAGDAVIVIKSTVPVGTGDAVEARIASALLARGLDLAVPVVSNPEFLKEGEAVRDCRYPDRIILGGDDVAAIDTLRELYLGIDPTGERTLVMDRRSAELSKYAANAMLASRISFINEMAGLADVLGADIESVRGALGSDPRIGPGFLRAGIGFGGSCFPKDLNALHWMGRRAGRPTLLVDAVLEVNLQQAKVFSDAILATLGADLAGRRLGIWGLAFKPGTDDMRDAPSLRILPELLRVGATLQVHDPVAAANARRLLPDDPRIEWCETPSQAALGADALVLLTEWPQYRAVSLPALRLLLKHPVVFDGRNFFAREAMLATGFTYRSIGRDGAPYARSAVSGDTEKGATEGFVLRMRSTHEHLG